MIKRRDDVVGGRQQHHYHHRLSSSTFLTLFFVFLTLDSCFTQVNSGLDTSMTRQLIETQIHAWSNLAQHNFDSRVAAIQDELESFKKLLSINSNQTLGNYNQEIFSNMRNMVNKHSEMFGHCFAGQSISNEQRSEIRKEIHNRFGPKSANSKLMMNKITSIVSQDPLMSFIVNELNDRPDWVLWIANQVESSIPGKIAFNAVASFFRTPPPANLEPQSLLQIGGSPEPDFSGDLIGSSDQLNSVSNGEISGESSKASPSQPDNSNSFASESVPETVSSASEVGQEVGGGSSGLLLDVKDNSQASLEPLSSSLDSYSVSEIVNPFSLQDSSKSFPSLLELQSKIKYNAGFSGSDSSSGSSLASVTSSQSSSSGAGAGGAAGGENGGTGGGGGGAGCCVGLFVVVVMLGIGCGAEYYMKEMHKFDGKEYEKMATENLREQILQLKEYLKVNQDRAKLLKDKLNGPRTEDSDDPPAPWLKDETGDMAILSLPLDFNHLLGAGEKDKTENADVDPALPNGSSVPVKSQGATTTTGDVTQPEQGSKKGKDDDKDKEKDKEKKEGTGFDPGSFAKIMVFFYTAYNSVPSIIVSKRFTFNIFVIILAVIISAAVQGA